MTETTSSGDSIRRSLSWTLFGEGVFAAAQWFSLMVVAKLGSPEALGRYALGLAVATPVIVLANLHLRGVYVVDVRERWRFEDYLGLRALTIPAALLVTGSICLATGWPWQTAAVVMLLGVVRASGSAADILYARAQRAETMASIGVSRAIRGVLWIGLLALGMAFADEVVALALSAVALAVFTLVYDLPKAAAIHRREAGDGGEGEDGGAASRWLRPRFEPERLTTLAWTALPMGLAAGLLGLTGNVPAYVLEHTHGVEEVGYFAAVFSVIQASGVLNMALGNAAVPRLAKLSVEDPGGFWVLLAKLLAVVAVLNGLGVVATLVAGELYLRLAYTDAYVAYLPELIWTAVAAVVVGLANLLSQTLTALSRFWTQLIINAAALVFSIVVAVVLIPDRGVEGAVWALLALAGFRFVLYLVVNVFVGPRASEREP